MLLTFFKINLITILSVFFCSLLSSGIHGLSSNGNNDFGKVTDSLIAIADDYYQNGDYQLAIVKYRKALKLDAKDSISIFKKLAYCYVKTGEPYLASEHIEKYITTSLDVAFVSHSTFNKINDSKAYKRVADKYKKKTSVWTTLCLCIGFMGFFIGIILNFRKRSDRIANRLMSAFVLLHSLFIVHLYLILTNTQYYFPHTLYFSTAFTFLYGPLIYFYFKRIKSRYIFKIQDVLHLVPSILLIILLFPKYILPAQVKLDVLINNDVPYLKLISVAKLITLYFYGFLIIKIYSKSEKNKLDKVCIIKRRWQRSIVVFCLSYLVLYTISTILVLQSINNDVLFHFKIVSMVLLVLYVSYTAFVQPSIFGYVSIDDTNIVDTITILQQEPKQGTLHHRYQNSGLTDSLSLELKERLLYLLDHEKIYRQNDITLQKLSELLDTTRHNTSQVINEHFNLNFFDLINTYRIREAKKLLRKQVNHEHPNIIDIVYEVGFNNKVTFYRSFKKYTKLTPSKYVKSHQE